ncbi:MAG: AAA family ATPase [Oligosphaeraceae bacterium]|nr:AAA family ATPase [Oligosphaeraceae bacterium]
MSDLFAHAHSKHLSRSQPLAARMRPRHLEEYIGQSHILAPGRLLRRAIQADRLSSLIFYGPPGTGKTTLASVIASTSRSHFVTLNAVMAGIADLRQTIDAAQQRARDYQQRSILFVDEVHRWNKSQQDALLPWVENGTVILIGATTENPYFTVNKALLSRSRVFQLKPLQDDEIKMIIMQALQDQERGYGRLSVILHDDALKHLADVANGDARAALNALELAVETTDPDSEGNIVVSLAVAEESIQKRALLYDREGDYHFDTISAFIKSMRGSDPDAALYWLAKMIYAGEDPRFIFRRMIIFASEDIGMADPQALVHVMAAAQAFDRIGLPEGHYPLAQATIYCATAPKSNSVMGFFDALKLVGEEREAEVPNHLRDNSRDKEGFGHGQGYKYPHAYREHWVAQQYLPASLQGKLFYQAGELGYERGLAEQVQKRRELQLAALQESETPAPEILSFSPPDKQSRRWLARAVSNWSSQLGKQQQDLLQKAALQRHHLVLDLSASQPVFLWEALRQTPEGGVWALLPDRDSLQSLQEQAMNLPPLLRPQLLQGTPLQLPELLAADPEAPQAFDCILGRNLLAALPTRQPFYETCAKLLFDGGRLCLLENIPRYGQRLHKFLDLPHSDWLVRLRLAEEKVYQDIEDPLLAWDENTLQTELSQAGFKVELSLTQWRREQLLHPEQVQRWFSSQPGSYASRLKKAGLDDADLQKLHQILPIGKNLTWQYRAASISASKIKPTFYHSNWMTEPKGD